MYLIFVKKNAPYSDVVATTRLRVPFTTEFKTEKYNIGTGDEIFTSASVFEVEQEAHAIALCEHLAVKYPTKEIVMAQVASVFQTDTPAVKRKNVSVKGILPE